MLITVNLQTVVPDAAVRLGVVLPARRGAAADHDAAHLRRHHPVRRAAGAGCRAGVLLPGDRDVAAEGDRLVTLRGPVSGHPVPRRSVVPVVGGEQRLAVVLAQFERLAVVLFERGMSSLENPKTLVERPRRSHGPTEVGRECGCSPKRSSMAFCRSAPSGAAGTCARWRSNPDGRGIGAKCRPSIWIELSRSPAESSARRCVGSGAPAAPGEASTQVPQIETDIRSWTNAPDVGGRRGWQNWHRPSLRRSSAIMPRSARAGRRSICLRCAACPSG